MKLTRLCGHLLLWTGFLGGALLSVRSTEIADSPWSTISWPMYFVALGIAVVGVVLLRATKHSARAGSEKHAGDVVEMEAILQRLLRQLQQWQTEAGRLPVHEVHRQIDKQMSDDLARFAEVRESLIDAFNLQDYAAIMTEFALAERTINRMWSASADGYIDEVESCLQRAEAHLEIAIRCLDEVRSRSNDES